jgi:hypothetical protein
MKIIKNIIPEVEGNNWAENASGNVTSQVLSACLVESQFEGYAAQQTLRFCEMVFLGGHLFEIQRICRCSGSDCSSGLWG